MQESNNATLTKEETKSFIDEIKNEPAIAPVVDIFESEDDFNLVINLPGVSKENVQLKIEEKRLTVVGKVNLDELKNRKYLLREKPIGNYFRSFNLSDSIDVEKSEAKLENGQLYIKLPKSDRVKPRTININ